MQPLTYHRYSFTMIIDAKPLSAIKRVAFSCLLLFLGNFTRVYSYDLQAGKDELTKLLNDTLDQYCNESNSMKQNFFKDSIVKHRIVENRGKNLLLTNREALGEVVKGIEKWMTGLAYSLENDTDQFADNYDKYEEKIKKMSSADEQKALKEAIQKEWQVFHNKNVGYLIPLGETFKKLLDDLAQQVRPLLPKMDNAHLILQAIWDKRIGYRGLENILALYHFYLEDVAKNSLKFDGITVPNYLASLQELKSDFDKAKKEVTNQVNIFKKLEQVLLSCDDVIKEAIDQSKSVLPMIQSTVTKLLVPTDLVDHINKSQASYPDPSFYHPQDIVATLDKKDMSKLLGLINKHIIKIKEFTKVMIYGECIDQFVSPGEITTEIVKKKVKESWPLLKTVHDDYLEPIQRAFQEEVKFLMQQRETLLSSNTLSKDSEVSWGAIVWEQESKLIYSLFDAYEVILQKFDLFKMGQLSGDQAKLLDYRKKLATIHQEIEKTFTFLRQQAPNYWPIEVIVSEEKKDYQEEAAKLGDAIPTATLDEIQDMVTHSSVGKDLHDAIQEQLTRVRSSIEKIKSDVKKQEKAYTNYLTEKQKSTQHARAVFLQKIKMPLHKLSNRRTAHLLPIKKKLVKVFARLKEKFDELPDAGTVPENAKGKWTQAVGAVKVELLKRVLAIYANWLAWIESYGLSEDISNNTIQEIEKVGNDIPKKIRELSIIVEGLKATLPNNNTNDIDTGQTNSGELDNSSTTLDPDDDHSNTDTTLDRASSNNSEHKSLDRTNSVNSHTNTTLGGNNSINHNNGEDTKLDPSNSINRNTDTTLDRNDNLGNHNDGLPKWVPVLLAIGFLVGLGLLLYKLFANNKKLLHNSLKKA